MDVTIKKVANSKRETACLKFRLLKYIKFTQIKGSFQSFRELNHCWTWPILALHQISEGNGKLARRVLLSESQAPASRPQLQGPEHFETLIPEWAGNI